MELKEETPLLAELNILALIKKGKFCDGHRNSFDVQIIIPGKYLIIPARKKNFHKYTSNSSKVIQQDLFVGDVYIASNKQPIVILSRTVSS